MLANKPILYSHSTFILRTRENPTMFFFCLFGEFVLILYFFVFGGRDGPTYLLSELLLEYSVSGNVLLLLFAPASATKFVEPKV